MSTKAEEIAGDKWFSSITKQPVNCPKIIPEVGIKIEVRLLMRSSEDWQYVQETLDRCREYGAAEIVEYKTF